MVRRDGAWCVKRRIDFFSTFSGTHLITFNHRLHLIETSTRDIALSLETNHARNIYRFRLKMT